MGPGAELSAPEAAGSACGAAPELEAAAPAAGAGVSGAIASSSKTVPGWPGRSEGRSEACEACGSDMTFVAMNTTKDFVKYESERDADSFSP